MADAGPSRRILAKGELPFTIEGRLIRELGERLVRQPEVALLELIKNSYDADATRCTVRLTGTGNRRLLEVVDDGSGMTFADFAGGWMRIGTGNKGARPISRHFGRPITGEKGIGRFAVRYLGQTLSLRSTADDAERGARTRLEADFHWIEFDQQEDLGEIKIPYILREAADDEPTGTTLAIGELKPAVDALDWKALRTGSMGVVSPIRALLPPTLSLSRQETADPGFELVSELGEEDFDVARAVLSRFALRATAALQDGRYEIRVFQRDSDEPYLTIADSYPREVGTVRAEIRFFPRREGLFTDVGFDGRKAYTWVRENSGVKVFDRLFQIRPYGTAGDDWLALTADAARSLREPASPIMRKHYAMDSAVKASTSLNWMLRLPDNKQVIGVVQVGSARDDGDGSGLVAAADREGFLANEAFVQLQELIRAALEAIAYADREISLQEANNRAEQELRSAREATRRAIEEIEGDRNLSIPQRARLVQILEASQERVERQRTGAKEREQQLEIMSLLGVVAGFMTHEFGVALSELRGAREELAELAKEVPSFAEKVRSFDQHIETLRSFVRYSRAYVEGARATEVRPYRARPRFEHVIAAFGRYAEKRRIEVEVDVEPDVVAPGVPPALYDGIAQNLFTNALKAVTASTNETDRRIVFRAWNDQRWHHVQVSDTGVGVPAAIRDLIFDPLFTTTGKKASDPLGTGMGLGLALVRRGAAAFGGSADLAPPPPGFNTCVEVRLPRSTAG